MLCRVTSAAVMRKPRNQPVRIMRYAALVAQGPMERSRFAAMDPSRGGAQANLCARLPRGRCCATLSGIAKSSFKSPYKSAMKPATKANPSLIKPQRQAKKAAKGKR